MFSFLPFPLLSTFSLFILINIYQEYDDKIKYQEYDGNKQYRIVINQDKRMTDYITCKLSQLIGIETFRFKKYYSM